MNYDMFMSCIYWKGQQDKGRTIEYALRPHGILKQTVQKKKEKENPAFHKRFSDESGKTSLTQHVPELWRFYGMSSLCGG